MSGLPSDVLIVGASLGGVAAAIRAAEMGASVRLVEETEWVGGQLSAQGVCTPDENRWIEAGGGTASYRAFRQRVREHYLSRYRLSEIGQAQPHFNPGNCWVSRLAMEPLVAAALLRESLQRLPGVALHLNTRVVAAEVADDAITALRAVGPDGKEIVFRGTYVLDATDLGDLLPMAGVEHVIGAESRAETGEPDAPETAHPEWIQPFTFPFALEMRPAGEDHTIAPPSDYEALKALQRYHILDGAMRGMFGELGWWTYRRVIAAENFDDPAFPCDIAMINTGSNDFMGGVVPGESPEADAQTLARARRVSLGYVYWLQTECPRVDDPTRRGYPEFRLRADLFGTPDGIAPAPYIRESRRIRALKTVVQQEIVAKDSAGNAHQTGARAAFFPDSCGIGHYWLDIHQGGTPEPGRFMETRPFQIPLGALIPARVVNLLAACKNLGVTHLTNGAYRLHPIEWNIGESAGALAAYCAARGTTPHALYRNSAALRAFQRVLLEQGVPLYWWADLPSERPEFVAAQTLAMEGIWNGGDDLNFRPDDPLTPQEAAEIAERAGVRQERFAETWTRGEAALWLFSQRVGR
jgi:hypothetical protein